MYSLGDFPESLPNKSAPLQPPKKCTKKFSKISNFDIWTVLARLMKKKHWSIYQNLEYYSRVGRVRRFRGIMGFSRQILYELPYKIGTKSMSITF